jgi:Putative DNA-binding domain
MSNLLRDLFDSIQSAEDVERLINEEREEDLHLEFKQKTNRSNGAPDDTDRNNLSETLSAFANADGGILLWGVATNHTDHVDRASEPKPITDPEKFRARLQDWVLSATQPPVDGVVLSVIRASDTGGFVKCQIPASDRLPHMAKDSRYYRRTSNGRRRVEHFEVEDMFARRRGPQLELTVTPRANGMELVVGLKNTGRGSARAPYLALACQPPFRRSPFGLDGNRSEGLPKLPTETPSYPWHYGAHADFVIHPGASLHVAVLTRENNVTPLAVDGVRIAYAIASEGISQIEGQHIVPLSAISV